MAESAEWGQLDNDCCLVEVLPAYSRWNLLPCYAYVFVSPHCLFDSIAKLAACLPAYLRAYELSYPPHQTGPCRIGRGSALKLYWALEETNVLSSSCAGAGEITIAFIGHAR